MGALRFKAGVERTIAFGSIGAMYSPIGAALDEPVSILQVTNGTDAILTYSYDGVNDHFTLLAAAGVIYDITTNKNLPEGIFLPEGTRLYVKHNGSAPSAGSTYVSFYFGENS